MRRFALLLFLISWMQPTVADPTLTDFGHGSLKVNGHLPTSVRRCLIVLLDNAGNDSQPGDHNAAYYEDLIFNLTAPRDATPPPGQPATPGSVNGYIYENSHGRFSLVRAIGVAHPTGSFGPLKLSDSERNRINTDPTGMIQGQVALDAAIREGFVLSDFDANRDGTVTQDELAILVVTDATLPGAPGGAARFINYQPAGSAKRFVGYFCGVAQRVDFATLTHELHHVIGNAVDLYYGVTDSPVFYQGKNISLNASRTLFGATISSAENPASFHLDPWHKMVWAWCEPRLVPVTAGGRFTILAAQSSASDAPLLLYDPKRGAGEYLLLEYRTKDRAEGPGYDGQVGASGLFIWHVQQNPDHTLAIRDSPFALTPVNKPFANWLEGPPNPAANNSPTPDAAWSGGMTTPRLRWNDGSTTSTRIRILPFSTTDDRITVEVLAEQDVWADPRYRGIEEGTFDRPYSTVLNAVPHVGYGGNLWIKSGNTPEVFNRLAQPMTIHAYAGPVTIGRR